MMWVLIIGGGCLLLVVTLVLWGIYLWHRGEELWSEVAHLGRQAEQLADLAGQLAPEPDPERVQALRDRVAGPRSR
ncbi:hypothetical protein GC722_06165 [Auraticoccus sp. F435]|uniref:Uncharacterized protein n=1 Tax=Auraticoccus cholistanensis TaxID=2656650 RepID=A0A6A9USE0_9ACTN|nr:hypothetical protein [Auraticoccus cholistanensis]MVA75611.1 hypothetical protein [Auraticoccus cholistanensis]